MEKVKLNIDERMFGDVYEVRNTNVILIVMLCLMSLIAIPFTIIMFNEYDFSDVDSFDIFIVFWGLAQIAILIIYLIRRRGACLRIDKYGIRVKDQGYDEAKDISWDEVGGCVLMYEGHKGRVLRICTENKEYEILLKHFFVASNRKLLAAMAYYYSLGNKLAGETLPIVLGKNVMKHDNILYNIFLVLAGYLFALFVFVFIVLSYF